MSINFKVSKKLRGKQLPATAICGKIKGHASVHLPPCYPGFKVRDFESKKKSDSYYKVLGNVPPTFRGNKSYKVLINMTKSLGKTCYGIDFVEDRMPLIICKPIFDEEIAVGCLVETRDDIGDASLGDIVSFIPDDNIITIDRTRLYLYDESKIFDFVQRLAFNILDGCVEINGKVIKGNKEQMQVLQEIDRAELRKRNFLFHDSHDIRLYDAYMVYRDSSIGSTSSEDTCRSSPSIGRDYHFEIVVVTDTDYDDMLAY